MKDRMIREAWDTANPTQRQRERMRAALEAHLEASGKGVKRTEEQVYFDFTLPEDPYAPRPQEKQVKSGKKERRYYSSKQAKTNWPAQIAAIAAVLMVTVAGGLFLGWMSGRGKETVSAADPQAEIAGEYLELLDQYETAIQEKWNGEKYAAEDMSILLRDVSSTSEVGYVLRDLNGDGEDELFLTNGDVIYDLYTLYGGKLSHIFSSMERDTYYLTNGSFFSEVSSGSGGVRYDAVWYLEGTELVHGRYTLTYDPGRDAENPWFAGEGMKPFTEESAQAAMDAYPHAVISFTPLSGKRVREPEKQPDDALLRLYAQKVPEAYQEYSFDKEKTFCFYDYDGDGTLELLLGAGEAVYRVLQPAADNGNQVEICQGVGGEEGSYLCEGYILEGITEREGYDGIHHYYRTGDPFLSGFFSLYWHDEGEIAYQKHDPNVISEGKVTLPTVTREKAQALQKTYQRLSLDWKPLSQFPVEIPNLESQRRTGNTEFDSILEKYETAVSERWDAGRCASEDISILVRDVQSADKLGYALVDLNGDGSEELLITDGNMIYDMYALVEGEVRHLLTGWERMAYYLCDDNVIAYVGTGSAAAVEYRFFTYVERDMTRSVATVTFDASKDPDNPWSNEISRITEQEAQEIINSYPYITIAFTPLSGKTEESKDDPASDEALMALYRESIADVQMIYKGLHTEAEAELSYCFYDTDGDGKEELLLGTGNSVYRILQPMTGKEDFIVTSAPTGEDGSAFLCAGNVFECVFYADGDYYNRYYRIGDADGSMDMEEVECICLKADSDTWYVGVKNPEAKTEEEVEKVREKYPHVKMDWKPLSQFPKPAVKRAENTAALKTGVQVFDAILESHDYMIRNKWTPDQVANAKRSYNTQIYADNVHSQLGWCMYDVTGDGKEDLLIGTDTFLYEIYSGETKEDILSHYFVVSLREGNVLLRNYLDAENMTWKFDKIKDERFIDEIQSVTFNSKEQTYTDGKGSVNEHVISKEKAMEILGKYPKLELEMNLLPAAAAYRP